MPCPAIARSRRLATAAFVILFTAWTGCQSAPPPPPAASKPKERPLSAAAVAFNDTARFIAGLKGRPGSPFEAQEKTAEWIEYAKGFEHTWAQFEKNQAGPVRAFEQRELAPIKNKGSFVFYPFSGPDVLYMNGFFPGRSIYVMVGLEPPGTIRAPAEFPIEDVAAEMHDWSKAMRSIFTRSFFVTSEMDKSFRTRRGGGAADGLLESICLLLARTGYTVEGIRHGNLTDEGEFTVVDLATLGKDAKGRPKRPMGVEVDFRNGPTGEPQKLFYFSTRLDTEFTTKPGFSRFLRALGQPDTLIKSASFVMHWNPTEAFRSQVLETSRLILQDDTGVPFRFLQPPDWTVKLYGEYSKPDKPFRNWYQKKLETAFADPSHVSPLGFSLGYGAYRRPSSMMLALRSDTAPVVSAAAPKKR